MTADLDDLWKDKTPANVPLIAFNWADIRKVERWDDDSAPVRPARRLLQAGFLLYEGIDPDDPSEEIVVLAETWDGEEQSWHGITCFPKNVKR